MYSPLVNNNLPENAPPYTAHQPRMTTNARINTDAPSIAEIIAAIQSLQRNKASELMVYQRSFIKPTPIKLFVCFRKLFLTSGPMALSSKSVRTCAIVITGMVSVLPAVSKIKAKIILERMRDPSSWL